MTLLRDLLSFDARRRLLAWLTRPFGGCEYCGSLCGVKRESSRTMYHWDGADDDPKNPNRPIDLCRPCAASHHEFWDDMWEQARPSI
jgi:hypothetical protein